MLELMNRAEAPLHSFPAVAELPTTTTLLARALDEVDFGIALLRADGEVLHLNHRARRALHSDGPLHVLANRLGAHEPCSAQVRLNHALHDAALRGLRRLLSLRPGHHPAGGRAGAGADGHCRAAAGAHRSLRRPVHPVFCAAARADGGRDPRLSRPWAAAWCPAQIAREQGVKLSTVRTQIASVRQKTGTPSIAPWCVWRRGCRRW
jgi:hypothetical protein